MHLACLGHLFLKKFRQIEKLEGSVSFDSFDLGWMISAVCQGVSSNFKRSKITLVKKTKFKGVEVGYTRQGVGECLVLLHGFLEDSSMWGGFVTKHSDQFDIITVDLLGHGTSDCTGYVHKMEEQAEAVLAVLKVEMVEKCVVIGHSMGGYVALAFAELYPARLTGFGLFHSTAYRDSEAKKADRERAVNAIMDHPDLFVEVTIPRLFASNRHDEMKAEIKAVIDLAKGHSPQGIIANARGMKERKDQSELLRNASVPVLFVHGNEDPVLPNELAQKQTQGCKHITTHFIDNVGHMGHLEAPEKCFNAISSFMNSFIING
ncbi:MAG: pimeloyl-ACP methyl ester carboxylesterase [Bacteroidia bacterium]|jgi:pimeloyl-ACP methyl ester carboxylesterase